MICLTKDSLEGEEENGDREGIDGEIRDQVIARSMGQDGLGEVRLRESGVGHPDLMTMEAGATVMSLSHKD